MKKLTPIMHEALDAMRAESFTSFLEYRHEGIRLRYPDRRRARLRGRPYAKFWIARRTLFALERRGLVRHYTAREVTRWYLR